MNTSIRAVYDWLKTKNRTDAWPVLEEQTCLLACYIGETQSEKVRPIRVWQQFTIIGTEQHTNPEWMYEFVTWYDKASHYRLRNECLKKLAELHVQFKDA